MNPSEENNMMKLMSNDSDIDVEKLESELSCQGLWQ